MPVNIPSTLIQEDQICIDHGVEPGKAHNEIKLSGTSMELNGSPLSPYKIYEVDSNAFLDLYNLAYGYRSGSNLPFLTVIKVFFGWDNGLVLLYKPMYLERQATFYDVYNNHYGIYNRISESSDYYYYDTANSLFDSPATSTHIADYIANFQIKRDGVSLSPHNSLNGVGGDITALTFTFQEIYTLIAENNDSDLVKIFNSIRTVKHEQTDGTIVQLFKHNILLGPKQLVDPAPPTGVAKGIEKFAAPLVNMYSNLSHMCPPSCAASFVFRLKHSPISY